jgi:hypothetical protein
MDATVFRGITPYSEQYLALADFAVLNNSAQRISIMGDPAIYEEEFAQLSAAFNQADTSDELALQTIATEAPTLEEIDTMLATQPQVIVYRGDAIGAQTVLIALVNANYGGVFVYPEAYQAAQAGVLQAPDGAGVQVVGLTSWANSSVDGLSRAFRLSYVTKAGELPDATAVAAYDLAWAMRLMVQRVGGDPDQIRAALPGADPISTTQGEIDPVAYGGTELLRSVAIYSLHPLGGMEILTRYDARTELSDAEQVAGLPTPLPPPSATPTGPTATVTSETLNVRSGPGFAYNRIGTLRQGDVVTVIGTIPDYSWFYVQASNGLGWINAQFVQLFNPAGGVAGIDQVAVPPTPTPGATATPAQPADISITNVNMSPQHPVLGQPFTATVTVSNGGGAPTGSFAVAATFEPGGVYAAAIVPNVEPFSQTVVNLSATLTVSGSATVQIVADLNNEVAESNEGNNTSPVTYKADGSILVSTQISSGIAPLTLAGVDADVNWTGLDFDSLNSATFGVINGVPFENVHVGQLTPGSIAAASVGTFAPGTVFGVRTGELHCGVVRIDSKVGDTVTLTYRMYNAPACP